MVLNKVNVFVSGLHTPPNFSGNSPQPSLSSWQLVHKKTEQNTSYNTKNKQTNNRNTFINSQTERISQKSCHIMHNSFTLPQTLMVEAVQRDVKGVTAYNINFRNNPFLSGKRRKTFVDSDQGLRHLCLIFKGFYCLQCLYLSHR